MFKRSVSGLIGIMILTLLACSRYPMSAQAQAQGGRSITVIPPSFELYANPGDSISEKIRVRNESNAETSYTIMVEDFKATGEEGSVDLVSDQSNTSYSLAKWVVPEPKKFTLKPKAEAEIPFSINVPKNAEPGGHYASVLVKIGGDADLEGSGASVATRVGSLILLRVSGNVREDAAVESFKTDKSYYEKAPVMFEFRTKNNGNNHIKPKGTIVITNIFGQKVAEIPLNGMNVMPDAIRKMDTEWKPSGFMASRYTATLVATYGQQNKPLSASTSFIILPKMALALIIVLIVLFLGLVGGRKAIKRVLHNLTR